MILLQFSSAPNVGSRLIAFATWSWASHVEFVLPDGQLLGARTHGGVQVRDPSKDRFSRVERYGVDAPETLLNFALSQVGKPYDYQGVFNFFARNRNWEETDSWFCSELVAYTFKQFGVPLIRADAYRITPRDLLMSPLIYEVP